MSISDQQLIARVVSHRDERAFAQLVLRYQSQVRAWARRLCRRDEASADDVAQEAFIKAHAALAGFRADAKFSVWLYRIVFNTAMARYRKKDLQWASLEEQADTPGRCEQTESIAKGDIKWAMSQLSEAQQVAISLCFEEGFSHEEASTIMNIPLGTVKTHIARAKTKLKTLLADWRP